MTAEHDCRFPEVLIENHNADDVLKTGMKVLAPCSCGEEPFDHIELVEQWAKELQAALLASSPDQPLYHWSPASRRKQILRYGLRPRMRSTTTSDGQYRPPYVCLADSPSWAWQLSGGQRHAPDGEWDLWQTWLDRVREPVVLADPDRPSGIYEVRTDHRIYKRDLWLVASRRKS